VIDRRLLLLIDAATHQGGYLCGYSIRDGLRLAADPRDGICWHGRAALDDWLRGLSDEGRAILSRYSVRDVEYAAAIGEEVGFS
jgi:hypothetical protein